MPIAQRKIEPEPLPGESHDSARIAGIGHNNPPPEERIPLEFREALLSERPDFLTLLDNLLGKVNPDPEKATDFGAVHRARCVDEDTLGKCGELVKKLRAAEGLVEATHRVAKAPYLIGGKLVDAEKNAFFARIGAGKYAVEELQREYYREQRRKEIAKEVEAQAERDLLDEERRKLEELARENDIDVAALPPPPPPPPPVAKAEPVRSDGGATVSRLTKWLSVVEDYRLAFTSVKDDAKVREAIDAAIQRIVTSTKGAKPLKGVRIYEDFKASNR